MTAGHLSANSVRPPRAIVVKFRKAISDYDKNVLISCRHSSGKLLMPWDAARTGAITVESGEGPLVLPARAALLASGRLRPLINFSSAIWEGGGRSSSVLLHLIYAGGNSCCSRRRGLNGIAALCDPILPSSYGPILSECGGNQYLHRQRTGPSSEGLLCGKQEPSPRSDENGEGEFILATNGHQPAWYPPPVT